MMHNRMDVIGGEFSVTCQDFLLTEKSERSAWPEFVGKRSVRCDSGRSALLLAIQHWQREHSQCTDVWIPSYLCSSVSSVIRRAGLRVQVYQDAPGEVLSFNFPVPQEDDLVLVVHYFGHVNSRALRWLSGESLRSWGVIEDCVQSPYSEGVGVVGDYAITSLRKWWSAPDGATLHFQGGNWEPVLHEPDEGFVSRRLLAKLLRPLGQQAEGRHLALLAEAEAQLDESTVARRASWVSEVLLATVDLYSMCQQRRQNWLRLATALSAIGCSDRVLRPVNAELASNVTPLAFPVRVEASYRDALRLRLASRQIFCPIHWAIDEQGPAADLARSMLSLPIDQRYNDDDMRVIVQEIAYFFDGSKHE